MTSRGALQRGPNAGIAGCGGHSQVDNVHIDSRILGNNGANYGEANELATGPSVLSRVSWWSTDEDKKKGKIKRPGWSGTAGQDVVIQKAHASFLAPDDLSIYVVVDTHSSPLYC
jgi:hypothetical protein